MRVVLVISRFLDLERFGEDASVPGRSLGPSGRTVSTACVVAIVVHYGTTATAVPGRSCRVRCCGQHLIAPVRPGSAKRGSTGVLPSRPVPPSIRSNWLYLAMEARRGRGTGFNLTSR